MTLPFNNQQVLDNPELSKDRFLLLGELDRDAASGVYNITVQPDGPIVALNAKDQAQIEQESGVVVPLRKAWDNREARAQYGLPENLRMIGAGQRSFGSQSASNGLGGNRRGNRDRRG